ncbi:MAG: C_GCAxxG_C_C family protein, partial [Planctomycetota bacterium]
MRKLSRRRAVASLGLLGAGGMLGVSAVSISGQPTEGNSSGVQAEATASWTWRPIDPQRAADKAYAIYPEGSCMYAVVGGIMLTLAEEYGEPYRSFPLHMMRYGRVGIGLWGTACGVFNGGAAVIGLFRGEKDPTVREALISQLGTWYEKTALPDYTPAEPAWADDIEPSVAGSVLCHVSVDRWCEKTGYDAYCMTKKERCRRLSAAGARKVAELLNKHAADSEGKLTYSPETRSCLECHGGSELNDIRGSMQCNTCHTE